MKYCKYKQMQEKEFNEFSKKYLAFAFSQNQLKKAMEKLKVKDKNELISIGGGGIIKKCNLEKYKNLNKKQFNELITKYDDDHFLSDAIKYEMSNHEYIINQDDELVLNVLGLQLETLTNNKRINKIYNEARNKYLLEVKNV